MYLAVSYTHLDVYKRQEHDIREYKIYYIDANGDLQEDKHRSNIKISHPFFSELVDQTAVSYTHLDVYKRQPLPLRWRPWNGIKPPLHISEKY